MKIKTPIPSRSARLEIIPLIDIMFFLLASFMMLSLQMQMVRAVKASLPTATSASSKSKPELVRVTVLPGAGVSVDGRQVSLLALNDILTNKLASNADLPVYLSGAADATHGDVIMALDVIRQAGVRRVAMAVQPAPDLP